MPYLREVVSARKLRDRGRAAPRRERHPAAIASRGWRRTPIPQWRVASSSVGALLRSLATIARPRYCRSRDRRSPWALTRDDQGVLLRPDRGEGAGGQGPLPGGVPRLRRVHAAAKRKGGRLRVLQGLPPRRGRAALDAQTRARGDAGVACSLWPAAVVSYDWSRTHARRRGGEALERLNQGDWPPASVVGELCGGWVSSAGRCGAVR
jgi:hypothetical protein